MSWTELFERYRSTEAELQSYVEGLPLWVNVWRAWMFVVFTAAIVFVVWKREARWLGVTMIVSVFAYNAVAMFSGVGRFPSIAFLVFWAPLAVYLARQRPRLATASTYDRIYAWWVGAALITVVVSVAFDTYNVAYSFIVGVP